MKFRLSADSLVTTEPFDFQLSEYAQEWAENLAKRGVLCYRPDTKYGENIFVSFWRDVPHTISPKDPIDTWLVLAEH